MNDIIVKPNISIVKAMKVINKAFIKCLIVADENKKLLGTLTDGDIRRAILKAQNFSESIAKYYFKKPLFLVENSYGKSEAVKLLREKILACYQ